MHLENSGKEIIDLKYKKNGVDIYFEDDTKMELTSDVYSHFYLYIGKRLNKEDIDAINQYGEVSKLKQYVLRLLNQRMYTEKQLVDKMKKKSSNEDLINEVIIYLKNLKMIDDSEYVYEMKNSYENKNYGKNHIIKELTNDGVKKEQIDKLTFEEENEAEKALKCLEKFTRKQQNKSLEKIKQDAYNHLLYKGFDYNIASKCISEFKFNVDEDEEKKMLEKQIEKYVFSHHLNIKEYADRQKVISYFTRKGFAYEMIISLIGG